MTWPMPQDFNEAVQNPATAFADTDLKSGQTVVGPSGLPLPRSGNFADVYQVRGSKGKDWAVKCFTRPVTGLEPRYKKVDEALKKAGLPFTIGFAFLNEGVMVHGGWRPAVKMEWVDGLQLNQVVRLQAGSPKVLDALGQMWSRLCKKLRDTGIAHADLQHGNVLLVAGSKSGTYSLKLIDYDGMYVPALANTPSGESGHPNYQHPHRAAKQVYSPDLDRFPHLVIATALKGLAVLGAKLWEKYDTGDNLLFTEDDFKVPAASALMKELWQSNDPGLQSLVGHLAIACGKPIPQTPWLDQIAPDGVPVPLTPDQARNAAAALGVPPPPSAVVVPVDANEYGVDLLGPAPSSNAFAGLDVKPPDLSDIPPRRRVREPEEYDDNPPRKQSLGIPLAIGGGVLALVLAAVAAVVILGGDKKPDETAQQKADDDKEKEKSKPVPPPVKEKDKERPKPPDVPVTPPKKEPIVPRPPADPDEFNFDPANVPELVKKSEGLATGNPSGVRFTATGEYIVAKDSANTSAVSVFVAGTGAKLAGFTEGESALVDFTCLPDGKVASWHSDQPFAIVWNPATGKGVGRIPVRSPGFGTGTKVFEASPDGRFVAMGFQSKGKDAGKIMLFDTESNKQLVTLEAKNATLRFTETRFIVGDADRVQFFKLPGGESEREVKLPQTNPGSRVYALSGDGSLVLHNTRGNKLHLTKGDKTIVSLPPRFTSLIGEISDDGRLVAVISPVDRNGGEASTHIEVLDVVSKKLIGRYLLGTGAVDVSSMAFAPDNSALAISRSGRRIEVIDMPREVVAVLPKPKDPMMPEPKPKEPKPKDPDPMPKPKDPPPMPKAVEKAAMPEEAALTKAESKLHALLKEDYAKKLPSERKALAIKLLGLADNTADDPAMRYVMLRDARDIGVELFDTAMAMQALDGILKLYVVDADAQRLSTFEKIKDTAKNTTALKTVADLALAASDVAMAADNHAFAQKYAQTAAAAAKRGDLPQSVVDEAESQITKAQRSAEAFKPVAEALARLKNDANDQDAAYIVGKHRCFVQGRWEEGIAIFAKGAVGEMKLAAALDASAPKTPPTDSRIADAWWQAAEAAPDLDKFPARVRARHWYALAFPALTGEARAKAETRLAFNSGGTDYQTGLIAEFNARVPAILMGKKARVDLGIDFNAGEFKAEGAGVATDLNVKWIGSIAPQRAGRFRLAVAATDPVIVRIDGRTVIDTNGKGARRDGLVSLPDRPVPIVVEFKCINTDKHSLKLLWGIPGTDVEEPVPPEVLLHDKKLGSALPKTP